MTDLIVLFLLIIICISTVWNTLLGISSLKAREKQFDRELWYERILYNRPQPTYMFIEDENSMRAFLLDAERRNNVHISEEAKQMLMIPISEFLRNLRETNFPRELYYQWQQSMETIILDAIDNPANFDKELNSRNSIRMITSQSIISAFANKYCKIPPFCVRY